MKRNSTRRSRWLHIRARNQWKRTHSTRFRASKYFGYRKKRYVEIVEIWQGAEPEKAFCLGQPSSPPSELDFEVNRKETIEYFDRLRRQIKTKNGSFVFRPDRPNAMPRIASYSDYSKMNSISTACAVVLAAEYERLSRLKRELPPTINLDSWNDQVFRKLFQLGFFEIVGLTPPASSMVLEEGDTMTMTIVSAENADDLQRVDQGLQRLGYFLGHEEEFSDEVIPHFLTALSEAMTNVTNHAYLAEHSFAYPHIGRYWVSATADRASRKLVIVMFDQGTTIPVTYPRLSRLHRVNRYLRRALQRTPSFDFENDGTYIRAAMRYGGSRTDLQHRGKGFPQMIDTLKRTAGGRFCVWSRGGWCVREESGRFTSGAENCSVGGTLIQWELSL